MPTSRTLKRPSSSSPGIRRILLTLLLGGAAALPLGATGAERLRGEKSAFLRSYADTQVDWMPWGEAAFARARQEQKPVFVAIGAFGNELSRAMGRQTFTNPATAAMLNNTFVCVLVDRDERPDVAALGVAYVRGVKQMEGWPINLWLTPEAKPYEGATYLPPSEEWGKPSFSKVAQQAKDAWADPKSCRLRAADGLAQLEPTLDPAIPPAAAAKISGDLNTAAGAWMGTFDATHGGFGDPPRSAEPELLRFLWRRGGSERDAAVSTLRAMANSAVRDPLDGGFFRSAADDAWRVPTAQKTLVDQARVAQAYLDAAQGPDAAAFLAAARGALNYALGRLQLADGTFAAVEDGTGDDLYYAWTEADIDAALGAGAAAFKKAHGVEPGGNVPADFDANGHFKGKNMLRSAWPADAEDAKSAARLLAVRNRRPAPARDERATAAAQGLMIAALARAGQQLGEPRYLQAAERALTAMRQHFQLTPAGELVHLRDTGLPASPADYAAVALGCRALAAAHVTGAGPLAAALLGRAEKLYFSAKSGRFFAVPSPLPDGFVFRPPAAGDLVSAEPLAVLARGDASEFGQLVDGMDNLVETGPVTPAGDVLLALVTAGR